MATSSEQMSQSSAESAIGAIEQSLQSGVVLTEEQSEWISGYVVYERMEKSAQYALADADAELKTYLSAVMLGTLICVKEDASAAKQSRDGLKQQLDAHQNKGAIAVLYGSDRLGCGYRSNIGKLCGEVLTDDGPVMKGIVKGLLVVGVDEFDQVKSELEKMQQKFRNKWKQ